MHSGWSGICCIQKDPRIYKKKKGKKKNPHIKIKQEMSPERCTNVELNQ